MGALDAGDSLGGSELGIKRKEGYNIKKISWLTSHLLRAKLAQTTEHTFTQRYFFYLPPGGLDDYNQATAFFFLKHLYWSIIALQWCVSFCFITK